MYFISRVYSPSFIEATAGSWKWNRSIGSRGIRLTGLLLLVCAARQACLGMRPSQWTRPFEITDLAKGQSDLGNAPGGVPSSQVILGLCQITNRS